MKNYTYFFLLFFLITFQSLNAGQVKDFEFSSEVKMGIISSGIMGSSLLGGQLCVNQVKKEFNKKNIKIDSKLGQKTLKEALTKVNNIRTGASLTGLFLVSFYLIMNVDR